MGLAGLLPALHATSPHTGSLLSCALFVQRRRAVASSKSILTIALDAGVVTGRSLHLVQDYSVPSGHALASAVFFGVRALAEQLSAELALSSELQRVELVIVVDGGYGKSLSKPTSGEDTSVPLYLGVAAGLRDAVRAEGLLNASGVHVLIEEATGEAEVHALVLAATLRGGAVLQAGAETASGDSDAAMLEARGLVIFVPPSFVHNDAAFEVFDAQAALAHVGAPQGCASELCLLSGSDPTDRLKGIAQAKTAPAAAFYLPGTESPSRVTGWRRALVARRGLVRGCVPHAG
jgi:hypothetical protein